MHDTHAFEKPKPPKKTKKKLEFAYEMRDTHMKCVHAFECRTLRSESGCVAFVLLAAQMPLSMYMICTVVCVCVCARACVAFVLLAAQMPLSM